MVIFHDLVKFTIFNVLVNEPTYLPFLLSLFEKSVLYSQMVRVVMLFVLLISPLVFTSQTVFHLKFFYYSYSVQDTQCHLIEIVFGRLRTYFTNE